jgi:RNA polymerase sigma factor (sigma-70 family)
MCEQALVAAAKQGQMEAFCALCQPLARKLIQSAHRITRNREDAEDALQDAFLSAFIHIKNFDGRSSFSTWLTRIAINSALMTIRKKRNSREIPIGSGELGANGVGWDVPDPSANPEKLYAQRESERILREAICELRPTIRQAVEVQLREHSMEETAGMIGVSVAAAKGRLFHGRRALRKAFRLRSKPARGDRQLSSTRWLPRMKRSSSRRDGLASRSHVCEALLPA